jgi:hypothetical protein
MNFLAKVVVLIPMKFGGTHMKIARRALAAVFVLSLIFSAPALAFKLPGGFGFTDDMPKGSVKGVVIAETAAFYSTAGKVSTLSRGDQLTLKGMKNASYARASYAGTSGYVNVKDVMMLVGVSAHVRADCWAYEYAGDRKVKLTFGAKVYVVGRYTDKNGALWLLCTNKGGDGLAYIKRSNLYR